MQYIFSISHGNTGTPNEGVKEVLITHTKALWASIRTRFNDGPDLHLSQPSDASFMDEWIYNKYYRDI